MENKIYAEIAKEIIEKVGFEKFLYVMSKVVADDMSNATEKLESYHTFVKYEYECK